jgi:hypothetical protein
MPQAETIVFLFALVAAAVLVARKLALPYPVVLVLVGLGLSFIPRLPSFACAINMSSTMSRCAGFNAISIWPKHA